MDSTLKQNVINHAPPAGLLVYQSMSKRYKLSSLRFHLTQFFAIIYLPDTNNNKIEIWNPSSMQGLHISLSHFFFFNILCKSLTFSQLPISSCIWLCKDTKFKAIHNRIFEKIISAYCCIWLCKDTKFKAIHNRNVHMRLWDMLYMTMQRY